ncbi:MAG: hypothetical protein NT178_18380 [Proteobacteria bacterium]|nr:hypothetical protein [Pseudomonadota bacterium]
MSDQQSTQNSVAHHIHLAAQSLLKSVQISGETIAEQLNKTLNLFLTWPFKAGPAYMTDSVGNTTTFDSLIYMASTGQAQRQPAKVDADAAACAIYAVKTLGPEELRAGYEHIAAIKRLERDPVPDVKYPINITPLGIIFAIDSVGPIEAIGEQMIVLNQSRPSAEWPDMVAILTQGSVSYTMAFPGEPIKGDLFLPNTAYSYVPPMYVHVFARGLGLLSLNRMCASVFAHLQTFSPGTIMHSMDEVLEGVAPLGITLGAYQFNLTGDLVPARNELWERGIVAPPLFRLEDNKGNLVSHLRFIPWQDGGIVQLVGKLPLEGILLFLGAEVMNAKIIRQSNGAISTVLPIKEAQFNKMLVRIQKQTNLVVRPEEPKWTVIKFADEGTASPFIARLFVGILNLREAVFTDDKKSEEFDKIYKFVVETLMNVRTTSKEITQILAEHNYKVSRGEIASLHGHVIRIDEPIDSKLRKQVEEFLNGSVRVLKDGMQKLMMVMKMDISFLYKKQGTFENRVTALAKTQPELAAYLRETRKWSERLIMVRNDLHEGWMLPRMTYQAVSDVIGAVEPQIFSQPVSQFVDYMLDRLCSFVEEITAYGLQAQMPSGISITEIPVVDRKRDNPERFRVTFVYGGMPIWSIKYNAARFGQI